MVSPIKHVLTVTFSAVSERLVLFMISSRRWRVKQSLNMQREV